ncbi:MAG: nodulation protein NfeD [Tannerellaceae bacterium]|jgi:membrane-bound serine protease (ClpP class)|nr:nodulation protein NfeD [Tannerellaceae bacterium]
MNPLRIILLLVLLAGQALCAQPEGKQPLIYKISIRKEINATSKLYLTNGMQEAASLGADAIIIHLNTYGGQVDMADSMRTAIIYSRIPTYVYVDNNAASAGALISIAARKIYMREGSSIGAATVVNETGEAMPDKYQSYLRAMMRATAEAHGRDTVISGRDTIVSWIRDPAIAEAMVDQRIVIPGLVDSTQVLTFTAEEALQWGYCDGIVSSLDQLITQYLGYHDYELRAYSPSAWDDLKGFLQSPLIQSLLILIVIGGIYFELQTPGIGFPSAAAVLAAILYFAPLYMDGMAQNWEILIFVVGVLLVALEIFVIPGFGLAGISGIILIIAGLALSLLDNVDFNFEGVSSSDYGRSMLTVLLGVGLGFFAALWISSRIGSRGIFKRVALATDLADAISVPVVHGLIGKNGRSLTVLRPSGKVVIDGEIYDAISETGFVEKGVWVKVVRTENAQVYVELSKDV